MNALVSIIIPTYNRAHLVEETLGSVLAQSYQNWECIVVDDGSSKFDYEKISKFTQQDNRFILLQRPISKLKGANACRNYGIQHSNGAFIIFFDSDDLMSASCLENRVNACEKHIECDFLVFSMGHFLEISNCYIDNNREYINLPNKKTLEHFFFGKLPWNVCRPIFKSKLIKNKIWFNENIQNFQDDEFNVRVLANLNLKYKSIDITDSYYRMELSNINKYQGVIGRQNALDSYYEYSKTIFSIIDSSQIRNNRNKLLLRYFSVLRHNISSETKLKYVYKTLYLINNNSRLSLKELLIFYLLIFFNKFYYNKKGYYKFIQYLKHNIK